VVGRAVYIGWYRAENEVTYRCIRHSFLKCSNVYIDVCIYYIVLFIVI
jgi:hypothetical protein